MEIKLENIYVSESPSRKTLAFQATLYINEHKVGTASNDGRGATFYHGLQGKGNLLIKEAEVWCRNLPPAVFPDIIVDGKPMTLPMDLELYIDNIITDWLKEKDLQKFRGKMEKEMRTAILFGIPDKTYRVMRYKMPIDSLIRYGKGVEQLRIDIHKKVLPFLQQGEKILNTNIPSEVMKKLGIEDGKLIEQVSGK